MKANFPLCAIAPLALLAACSGGADADGDGEVSSNEAAAEAGNVNIQPGEWEMTAQLTEFDVEGITPEERDRVTREMGQPTTSSTCVTPEQAANPQGGMFTADESDECTYSEFDMSGGRLLIDASCQGEGMPGAMTLHMEGAYTRTSYNLTTTMSLDGGPTGGPVRMSGTVAGRRTGECTAEPTTDEAENAAE